MVEGLFQPTHLILILVIVLIVFGPGKLAELGSELGKGMRELRRGLEARDETPGQSESRTMIQPPTGPTPS